MGFRVLPTISNHNSSKGQELNPLKVASRAKVPHFQVMKILEKVADMRAEGRDVISLCAGEPSGGAPRDVSVKASEIHASEIPLTYTSSLGILELRQAIANHYLKWYGLEIDAADVAITTGSSGAFILTFLASFSPGERVALARPGYPAYSNILRSLGCEVVEIDCGPEERFQPTPKLLDRAVAKHGELSGLIVASPANPSGAMVSRTELKDIAQWCAKNKVRLISDEIYHGITYPESESDLDPRGVCAWELDQKSIVISSFSKYWGMTGWRLGWILMPKDLSAVLDALASNVALCPPTPAQLAAVEAFTQDSYNQSDLAVAEFATIREIVLSNIERLQWGPVAPVDGAFYLYADLGEQLGSFADSTEYCAALLEEEGVAIVPGHDFDTLNGGRSVRLSFAAGRESVAEAVERIIRFQKRRHK